MVGKGELRSACRIGCIGDYLCIRGGAVGGFLGGIKAAHYLCPVLYAVPVTVGSVRLCTVVLLRLVGDSVLVGVRKTNRKIPRALCLQGQRCPLGHVIGYALVGNKAVEIGKAGAEILIHLLVALSCPDKASHICHYHDDSGSDQPLECTYGQHLRIVRLVRCILLYRSSSVGHGSALGLTHYCAALAAFILTLAGILPALLLGTLPCLLLHLRPALHGDTGSFKALLFLFQLLFTLAFKLQLLLELVLPCSLQIPVKGIKTAA